MPTKKSRAKKSNAKKKTATKRARPTPKKKQAAKKRPKKKSSGSASTPVEDKSKDARKHGAYKKAKRNASQYADDPKKLKDLVNKANRRASSKKAQSQLADVWHDLQTILRMLKAYALGNYRDVPYYALVALIAAIGYFISPIDLIPDVIFGLGFLDDAAVLGFAISQFRDVIDQFRQWEEGSEEV